MDRPFNLGEKVWFYQKNAFVKGEKQYTYRKRVECVIVDGFYQYKTTQRREGWRVIVLYVDAYGNKQYMERRLETINF